MDISSTCAVNFFDLNARTAPDVLCQFCRVIMNISQPVSSAIGSVDFAFLSQDEIKRLSVKAIQNPTTFDTLLNPVPGGLYDPALGAWGDIQ